ncbi:MAG: hypothetical protein ACREMZ_00510 [Gemmatimonadales bacterium]
MLDFPEPGLDDTASYQGYQTRFYRDSKQNTVQIYLEPRGGRAVLVWADGANESAGFTVRDSGGRPVRLTWAAEAAEVDDSGAARSIEYHVTAGVPRVELGWFLLGSMRVERDFVYAGRHRQPFTAPPFVVAEESLLVAGVARLPSAERARHLSLLGAKSLSDLRSRLQPAVRVLRTGGIWTVRVERPSLDGRNRLALELRADTGQVAVATRGTTVSLRARSGPAVRFAVRVTTDAAPLNPLSRNEIFNRAFLAFLAGAAGAKDSAGTVEYRRLERQVRAVELLSTEEKLMAGLPNFATYFGRDMMMSALMMRPIWTPAMFEHVIASVLRKLGPSGQVSHEEALGGQAIRENAVVYDSLIAGYFRAARAGQRGQADGLLQRARGVLRELQATRENYHMIDDEFQLPLLVATYLSNPAVSPGQKRRFLLENADGRGSRLWLMLQEIALVSTWTQPYAQHPRPLNLVSFPKRDSIHWRSASWRDSDAGYAGGRFAMDVNAIWVPRALEAVATILATLPTIGVSHDVIDSVLPASAGAPLADYARNPESLRHALETWRGARRHFEMILTPDQVRDRVQAKLSWLPQAERRYWETVMGAQGEMRDSVTFLALSLDAGGKPIPVANTDPATGLFLESQTARTLPGFLKPAAVLREIRPFLRPYPVGLFVEGLGPLVANDVYAGREVWERFRKDPYHGPRVVWGREVNLLLIGLASRIAGALDAAGRSRDPALETYLHELERALRQTLAAVHASGLEHNELWSYEIAGGRLLPVRYGTSSDIQLWNTTNLAVQYVLSRLPPLSP